MPPGAFAVLIALLPTPEPTEPDVIATHVRFDGAADFAFRMNGMLGHRPAGALRWDIPARVLYTGGLDRQFDSYSADPFVGVRAGPEYPFQLGTIDRPRVLNLPDDEAGQALAERKTRYIRELYGRFYPDPAKPTTGNRAAFQIALWELLWETDVPDGPMPFNLSTGTFRGDDPGEAAVRQAQEYLLVLTGDEQQYEKNLLLTATDLIRLDGLKTPDGEPAQSQIVLRLRSGAGDGSRGNTMTDDGLVGSGGLSVGGGGGLGRPGGFPGGGLTPGGPSGGGFAAPGLVGNPLTGGGGNTNPGGGNVDVPITPPAVVPPGTNPPLGGDRDPPGGGPNGGGTNPGTGPGGGMSPGVGPPGGFDPDPADPLPPAAVPAPGGLVIGLIGVGVFAARRRRRVVGFSPPLRFGEGAGG